MTAFASGVGGTGGIGGQPAEAVCLSTRAETLVPWKFFFSFLAVRCASRKVSSFRPRCLAVLDEVLLVTVWIQTVLEFGLSPLPEVELDDDGEFGARIFV